MKRFSVVVLAFVALAVIAFFVVLLAPIATFARASSKETAVLYRLGVPDAWLWRIGVIPYDYPLGPFAHVQHWAEVFSNTNNVRVQTQNGRPYYDFTSDPGGGYLDLNEIAVGQIDPAGLWVAAIPLESGGSGGVFQVVVFESDGGGQPRFVGIIDDGDSTNVTIRGRSLIASTPYREPNACMACYDSVQVNDYAVTSSGLSKVRQRVLPLTSDVWQGESLDVVPASALVPLPANRAVNAADAEWPIHLPSGLSIPALRPSTRVLIRSHNGPQNTDYTIADGVFVYHGGLDK